MRYRIRNNFLLNLVPIQHFDMLVREAPFLKFVGSIWHCPNNPPSSAQWVPEPAPLPNISFDTRPHPIQF